MSNEIQVLKQTELLGQQFTVYGTVEEPLFLAKEVANWINHTNPSKMLEMVDDDEKVKMFVVLPDLTKSYKPCVSATYNGSNYNFLTENGVYEVLMQSNLPIAKQFKKGVKTVLHEIRTKGGYIATKESDTPEMILARAVIVAQKTIEEKSKQLEQVNKQVVALSNEITTMKPKVSYYDTILNSKGTVTTTQVAQDYGTSAKAFNKQLEAIHIQRKVNGQWILYAPYISQGYVHSKPVEITHHDGKKQTVLNTEWTQKGRNFLYNALKNINIIPLIER